MTSIKQASAPVRAFTLIELLAVMTIILILAGLILSIAGNANYKAATSRAQGEIQALSTALESYKTDNGAYPAASPSNALDPTATGTTSTDPANSGTTSFTGYSGNSYQAAGEVLFQALAGVTGTGTSATFTGKSYFNYNVNQIASTSGTLTTPPVTGSYLVTTYFCDPFGFAYGYSTDYASELQTAATGGNAAPNPANGYNPTFDLWSTAGYSANSGKTYPTNVAAPNTLWVKNW